MKHYRNYLIILLLLIIPSKNYSQIIVKEIHVKTEIDTTSTKIYDGYSNIEEQQQQLDYQQYIGQQIYFPNTYEHKYFISKDKSVIPKGPFYLTIKNIIYGSEAKKIDKEFGFGYKMKPDIYYYKFNDEYPTMPILVLQGEDNSEKFYMTLSAFEHCNVNHIFISVSFFLHQRKLFDNKKFLLVTKEGSYEDELTEKKIEFNSQFYGGEWTCSVDVITKKGFDGKEYTDMKYLLKNDFGHLLTKKGYETPYYHYNADVNDGFTLVSNISDSFGLIQFIAVDEYKNIIQQEKMLVIENKTRVENNIKNIALLKKKKLETNITKYGKINGTLITNGKVEIGMTKEMCIASCGTPFSTDVVRTKNFRKETLIYYYGKRLYLENNILVKIEY